MIQGIRHAFLLALRQREAIQLVAHELKIAAMQTVVKGGPVFGEMTLKEISSNKAVTNLVFDSFVTSCLAISRQMPSALLRGGLEALKSPEFKDYLMEMMIMNTVNYIVAKATDIDPKGVNLSILSNPSYSILNKLSQVFADTLFSNGLDSANNALNNQWNELIQAYPDSPPPLLSNEDLEILTKLPPDEISQKMDEILEQKLGKLTPEITPTPPVVAPEVTPAPAPQAQASRLAAPQGQAPLVENASQPLRRKSIIHSLKDVQEVAEGLRGLAGIIDEPDPKTPKPKR